MGKGLKKSRGFSSGAVALTLSMLVSKIIGAVYRIPLTNILGAEGMGMYQLIFPVYALMLTLSSGAMPVAVSRLVAEQNSIENKCGIYSAAKIILFVLGLAGFLFLISFASVFSYLQGNPQIKYGYYVIAPAVLVVSAIAGLRGYFQGNLNMYPTSVSHITEQTFKLILGLTFSVIFLKYGIIYAVCGALIGITFSEIITFAVLYVIFLIKRKGIKVNSLESLKANGKKIIKVASPVLLGGLVFPLAQFIDSFLIVNLLVFTGNTSSKATMLYGLLTGPVSSLINLPVVLSLTIAVVVLPSVTKLRINHDIDGLKKFSEFSLKISLFATVPFAVFFFFFSQAIIGLLYPSFAEEEISICAKLLSISSLNIIFLSQIQIYTSVFQALDRLYEPVKITVFGAVLKFILNIILIFFFGIEGAAFASLTGYFATLSLFIFNYRRLTGKKTVRFVFIKIFIVSLLSVLTAFAVYFFMNKNTVAFFVAGFVAVILYFITVTASNLFDDAELSGLKGGKIILSIAKKLKLRR